MDPTQITDPAYRDRLDALVFQYLERVDAGETVATVLEALCAEHPVDAQALRRGVALLRDVRLHPGAAEDGLPERVGGFRLLRRVGSGGMGVVYLAEQENPSRRVALKLVRPDQLWFEGYRERFTREIESAGRLAHPGIAPVYEMGEHDGVPWFSQEYVVGAPLSALLEGVPARSPETLTGADLRAALEDAMEEQVPDSAWNADFFRGSWVDLCLRIARQVADALRHAHERGVLHRDVKPGNILLTPGGRAVLVDFGLASLQGTERLTQTGAQLGSLHYMPPEQLDGRVRELGPRSDVYSLGVTLYELLTLRAPYSSRSVQRLHGLILDGQAPAPRALNQAVSRDVDVVVRCAMEPDPDRRYESIAAFAADLAAAQEHRPIAARPAGPVLRLSRWVRRRPAAAVGLVAGFLILVVAPTVFGVQSYRAAHKQGELNESLTDALAESRELLDATLAGYQGVVRWTAHDALKDVPGFQTERLAIIDKGLAMFGRVVRARPQDDDVRFNLALMMRTRANILGDLGRLEEADEQYEQAALVLEEVVAGSGESSARRRELASVRYQQAHGLRAIGRLAEAGGRARAALTHQRSATALAPDDPSNQRDLAAMASVLADDLHQLDPDSDEAAALLAEGVEAARRATRMAPTDPRAHRAVYEVLATRGEWSEGAGRERDALMDHTEAIVSLERGLVLDPADRTLRAQQVQALGNLARLELRMSGDAQAAVSALERAMELCDALIADFPDVPDYARTRAVLLDSLAVARRRAGDFGGGLELHEQAMAELLAKARAKPGDAKAAIDAAVATVNATNTLLFDESLGDERFDRILDLCDQAEELAEPYARQNPGTGYERNLRMLVYYKRGATYNQLEWPERIREQIDALRALDHDVPMRHFMTAKLLMHWANRADDERGRVEALAEVELAVEQGFADLASWERSEVELELAGYPRVAELAELVRRRAAEE